MPSCTNTWWWYTVLYKNIVMVCGQRSSTESWRWFAFLTNTVHDNGTVYRRLQMHDDSILASANTEWMVLYRHMMMACSPLNRCLMMECSLVQIHDDGMRNLLHDAGMRSCTNYLYSTWWGKWSPCSVDEGINLQSDDEEIQHAVTSQMDRLPSR